jgi:hypothetical protein
VVFERPTPRDQVWLRGDGVDQAVHIDTEQTCDFGQDQQVLADTHDPLGFHQPLDGLLGCLAAAGAPSHRVEVTRGNTDTRPARFQRGSVQLLQDTVLDPHVYMLAAETPY